MSVNIEHVLPCINKVMIIIIIIITRSFTCVILQHEVYGYNNVLASRGGVFTSR